MLEEITVSATKAEERQSAASEKEASLEIESKKIAIDKAEAEAALEEALPALEEAAQGRFHLVRLAAGAMRAHRGAHVKRPVPPPTHHMRAGGAVGLPAHAQLCGKGRDRPRRLALRRHAAAVRRALLVDLALLGLPRPDALPLRRVPPLVRRRRALHFAARRGGHSSPARLMRGSDVRQVRRADERRGARRCGRRRRGGVRVLHPSGGRGRSPDGRLPGV